MGNDHDKRPPTRPDRLTSISKLLSLVLRHEPDRIGLSLDRNGWVPVQELLEKAAAWGRHFSEGELREVVATSDKQRFSISDDGLRIRANQGHSIGVDLALPALAPPDTLFHGTATRFVQAILRDGLDKRSRHHVHMTEDASTAIAVGQRHGLPVVLRIDARAMQAAGHVFHRSDNNVWLVERVPPEFLQRVPS
jgi:putative RNA 2'-phosphotransferase